jgi:hypothetical protein
MGFVSVEVLAEELHISARRIQQLVKLGMPRDARGRYDISACRAWHRRYLRGRLVPPGRSAARLARLNAENRLLELEFADRKSRVVEWSRIETLNAEMVATIHAELLALPGELAPAIAGESDPLAVGRILSAAIRASLARLASQVHATAP